MGTNFYWTKEYLEAQQVDDMDPRIHIGKRSAAGAYCWDCGVTLCKEGQERIHYSVSGWYDACPQCGKKDTHKESLIKSAAGVELGFARQQDIPRKGVSTCCSFIFAQDPVVVVLRLQEYASAEEHCIKDVVRDEYDRKYSADEFLEVLRTCPVRYFDSIGKEFS